MSEASDGASKPLPYRGHPGSRRPRWRRVVAMIIISVMVLLAYEYSSDLFAEARFLYYQRQWEHFTLPADQVVFDSQFKYGALADPLTRESIAPMVGNLSTARRSFPQIPHNTAMGCNSGLLLHSLRSRRGAEWIACVDVAGFDIVYADHTARVMALEIGTLPPSWAPPRIISIGSSNWYIDCPASARLRFFPAQFDPADSSHFTIRYEFDGSPGHFDGYLQDNGTIQIVPDRGTGGGSNPHAGWRPTVKSP